MVFYQRFKTVPISRSNALHVYSKRGKILKNFSFSIGLPHQTFRYQYTPPVNQLKIAGGSQLVETDFFPSN